MALEIAFWTALLVMVVADFGVVYGHFSRNEKMFQAASILMMVAGAGLAYLYFFTDCPTLIRLKG